MVPALVQLQQARQGRQAVCQRVARGMQREEAQLGESALVDEDVGEGGVANGILQLEDCHFAHRLLLCTQSGDQLGDIHCVHAAANIAKSQVGLG